MITNLPPYCAMRILALLAVFTIGNLINISYADGPPSRSIDVSKIPNATPIQEPLSRYGNPPSYVVMGKEYYVMPNADGYREQGIASWYGTKFHKRLTSSGEPYNMYAMTAAHKTLPLPSYVKVTNLDNGKTIIVKVNDRGPFHDDRILDLSYVAAKKLDIIAHGTGSVAIEVLTSPHTESLATYLQIGSFSQRNNADQLRNQVHTLLNYPVTITPTRVNRKNLYRVYIGPLNTHSNLQQIKATLQQAGINDIMPVVLEVNS